MRIKFYGHSDDCVEIEIVGPSGLKRDEWYAGPKGGEVAGEPIRVATIGGVRGVIVRAIYDGCWSWAVGKTDEDRALPPWTFTIADEHGYSVALTIDTGDDIVTVRADQGDLTP